MSKVRPLQVKYGDDPEMDRWMALSEAEQEAEIDQAVSEHNAWWDTLSRLEKYRHMRKKALEAITRKRRILNDYPFLADLDTFKEDIRVRLLKIRSFLATGIYSDD